MRLACTGFVSEASGSVASANALILRGLLDRGAEVDFYSKPTFVDPRPAIGARSRFRFIPTVNSHTDTLRRKLESVPGLRLVCERIDAASYNHHLVKRITGEHKRRRYDCVLWLGDYARGAIPGVSTVSFVQGPVGTDARSVLGRWTEIRRLAGIPAATKWYMLSQLRLSRLGIPPLRHTAHFIVGSSVSRSTLVKRYGILEEKVSTLPYPIDLKLFHPSRTQRTEKHVDLRVLWLGRIIPRKRLDVFLDGAALALKSGLNLAITIAGDIGFIPGYEKLIRDFAFPEHLQWIPYLPRAEVPALLHVHDVLAQPSEEENFGSSIAEAQACGLPVIVGQLNGNCDYLCDRDIHLADYRPETFAVALRTLTDRKREANWGNTRESLALAEKCFSVSKVTHDLSGILREVSANTARSHTVG